MSSKALKVKYAENEYRFNKGTELQNQEFNDGSGLELYETALRGYDPQIGRFGQIDPLSKKSVFYSSYAYCGNKPVNFTDPSGTTMASQISDNIFSSPYLTPEFFGGGGGGGGYMDSQGNIWHGTDPLLGTAAQGIQYQAMD